MVHSDVLWNSAFDIHDWFCCLEKVWPFSARRRQMATVLNALRFVFPADELSNGTGPN